MEVVGHDGKTKSDRQFERLDERLLDIQGRLGKIRKSQHEESAVAKDRFDALVQILEPVASLALIKEELGIIHGLVAGGVSSGDSGTVLQAINNLSGKVDTMSSNVDRIEKEAADLAEDAVTIKQALTDLKTLVTDLQAQVAQGQVDQGRLDAAATKLEGIDDDLDSLTTTTTEPSTGGGSTGETGGGGVTP